MCTNSETSINARIEVQCSALETECKSFDYAWNCLYKNGECLNSDYDGNGKIKMDKGSYSFNESIIIDKEFIILEGSEREQTHFLHSSINNTLIYCHNRCYLTFSNLSYSINKATTINIDDGGQLIFINVYFQNMRHSTPQN